MWLCKCDCGREATIAGKYLRNGRTQSCGCLRKEVTRAASITHGKSRSATYAVYRAMLNRCYNEKQMGYARYGAIGVKVCDRWLEGFGNFLIDMGERPPDMSLDRINPFGIYEPSNCRWATRVQQSQNTRKRAIKMRELERTAAVKTKFPEYVCHKKVRAAKIIHIEYTPSGARLFIEMPGQPSDQVYVLADWMDKHRPKAGGYIVVYENGYESYSPAAAFETGYTLSPLESMEIAG